jgi:acyl-homoserine lactone synthase
MLHILRFGAQPIPDTVMRAMFAARKRVFADLLKWNVPVVDGRFEVDQFDTEHAQYLVLVDRSGGHLGSARLLPTMRPHILDSLYPGLCDGAPPRADDIFEVTSGILTSRRRSVSNAPKV